MAHLPLMDTLPILVDTNKTPTELLLDNTEMTEVIHRTTAEVVRKTWHLPNLPLDRERQSHADIAGEERFVVQVSTRIPRGVAQIANVSNKNVSSHLYPLKLKLSFQHMPSTPVCEIWVLDLMEGPDR